MSSVAAPLPSPPAAGAGFDPSQTADPVATTAAAPAAAVVFVTGGVCSSLGKGIAAASLARLLGARGLRCRMMKLDPYLSVDPGLLAPEEHGEVYVTRDGAETDLDLGHYFRLGGVDVDGSCSVTSGKVLSAVLAAERRGDFLGHTVQMVPHVVDGIIAAIDRVAAPADPPDVVIVELGGTVGDMEVTPFLEAFRRFRARPGQRSALVHLALVPEVGPNREMKTKPAQHSVALLRSFGLTPDVLLARASQPITDKHRAKLSMLCGLPPERVLAASDVASIYLVPEALSAQGFDAQVCATVGLTCPSPDLIDWASAVSALVVPGDRAVRVGLCGKYRSGADTYLSVLEALDHAAANAGATVELRWVDVDEAAQRGAAYLDALGLDAVVVPGGFGSRGVPGKLATARWARESGVPFLGLCLGLQVAVVEFARHVAGVDGATSAEWGEPGRPVVSLMDAQRNVTDLGGTMRLGEFPALLEPGSLAARLYAAYGAGEASFDGRWVAADVHRHRFEVNPEFHDVLRAAGLRLAGLSPDGALVEHVELPGHRFFVATQAHPEFGSRPGAPHPLFAGLVAAALGDELPRP